MTEPQFSEPENPQDTDRYKDLTRGSKLRPGLHIVATPIGNLRDISLRALDTLEGADLIACEDTRVTGKLLAAYGIRKPTISYHDHNADRVRPKIMEALDQGKIVVFVSDAGTPLVSDPGYKLVRDAVANGHAVTPVPGASAPLAALMCAGLPSDRFAFLGFVPVKQGERRRFLEDATACGMTAILFETGKRLSATLTALAEGWPNRETVVARELTKLYEEFTRGTAASLARHYADAPPPKGEIVLLLGPPAEGEGEAAPEDIDAMLRTALETHSVKDAARTVATATGKSRKELYERAVAISKGSA